MNATGEIQTIESCQGHSYGIYGRPPYVYFKAPVNIAVLIERKLREYAMLDSPVLQSQWIVQGCFDGNYDLTFFLYSPEYHQKSSSLKGAFWFFGLNRKRLDMELLFLVGLIEQAMLLNIRDDHKPQITTSNNDHDKSSQLG